MIKRVDTTTEPIFFTKSLINQPDKKIYDLLSYIISSKSTLSSKLFDANGRLIEYAVKSQLGTDLHRISSITINSKPVNKQDLEKFADNQQFKEEAEYFYGLLPYKDHDIKMMALVFCLQSTVQYISDMIMEPFNASGLMQQSGTNYIRIDANKIEYGVKSSLINMTTNDEHGNPTNCGKLQCSLIVNIHTLGYSIFRAINNTCSATNRPPVGVKLGNTKSIMTGLGVTTAIATSIGSLAFAGLLGGRVKKSRSTQKRNIHKKRNIKKKKKTQKKK